MRHLFVLLILIQLSIQTDISFTSEPILKEELSHKVYLSSIDDIDSRETVTITTLDALTKEQISKETKTITKKDNQFYFEIDILDDEEYQINNIELTNELINYSSNNIPTITINDNNILSFDNIIYI